jgi:hypothetical protein
MGAVYGFAFADFSGDGGWPDTANAASPIALHAMNATIHNQAA